MRQGDEEERGEESEPTPIGDVTVPADRHKHGNAGPVDAIIASFVAAAGIVSGFVGLSAFPIWIRLWATATVVLVALAAFLWKRSKASQSITLTWAPQHSMDIGPLKRWGTALAAVVVGVPLLTSATFDWPADPSGLELEAHFEYPEDGEEVPSPFMARGTANLPRDHSLWILTRPEDGKYYTTNATPLVIDRNGEWSFRLGIGSANDDPTKRRRYDLYLVGDITGKSPIEKKLREDGIKGYVSFGGLPEGVEIFERVIVYRMR